MGIRINLEHWPLNLRYIFNQADVAAGKVILVSTYDTFAKRTLVKTKRIGKNGKKVKGYESRLANVFNMVLLDEGHRLRHSWTQAYEAVKCLKADIHWFLTATPVQNSLSVSSLHTSLQIVTNPCLKEILGLLLLLWPRARDALKEDEEASSWLIANANEAYESFTVVDTLPTLHRARLLFMNPKR